MEPQTSEAQRKLSLNRSTATERDADVRRWRGNVRVGCGLEPWFFGLRRHDVACLADRRGQCRLFARRNYRGRFAGTDRGDLVDGTREIEQRYQQSGQLVRDRGGNGWAVAGAGVGGAAVIVASAAPATIAGAATFFTAGAVAVVAGAHFAGAAVERMLINAEIKRRQTTLPVTLPRGAEASLALFFPITPLSGRTQVVYADRHGEHRLDIGTRAALLELPPPPTLVTRRDPDFPGLARRRGIIHGYVVANLTLDRKGRVQNVNVIQSVPPGVFDAEAHWTFKEWTYTGGHPDRTVEARLEFKR